MILRNVIKVQRVALGISTALLIVKFVAWYITHSNAVLTDALESIINVIAGSFALYAVILSAKPNDADHPYGHGKIEFIVTGIEGGMITLAGLLMCFKSVMGLFEKTQLQNLHLGLILTGFSGGVNWVTACWLISTGKKHQSLPLQADGEHLRSDAYSSFAVIGGLVLIWLTGWQVIDNLLALLIGAWILWVGYRLIRKSIAGIMDEANWELVEDIAQLLSANRKSSWIDVHNLRVIQYGNKLHIDCHITFPFYQSLEKVHAQMDELAELMNKQYGKQVEFFIHPDPCTPPSCKICSMADCAERKFPFEKQLKWTYQNVSKNQKHSMP